MATEILRLSVVPGCDGGSIVVGSAGARVLRLIGQSGYDFFWLNQSLADGAGDVEPASYGWKNLGGDRTWLAPEPDFFWSDSNDIAGTYRVPEAMDPGKYQMDTDQQGVRLSAVMDIENLRLGGEDKLSLEKCITAAPNPLRHSKAFNSFKSAEYVGYQQITTLSILSDVKPGHRLGMWHISQVPASGEILIPVSSSDTPMNYIEASDGMDCVTLSPGLIRFRVDCRTEQKIGIKADSVLGRIGYLRCCDDGIHSLIIRNFLVNPSADYIDTPWDDTTDMGYAVQCYSDSGSLGSFGEFEYHSPAIGYGTGMTSYTDCSQVWAFRSDESVIKQIAERLLNVRI